MPDQGSENSPILLATLTSESGLVLDSPTLSTDPLASAVGPGATESSSQLHLAGLLPTPQPLDAEGRPQPGEQIGDFELLSVLGKGGFATVYLARQVSLDRQVALKVSADRGGEARTMAGLEHDHIVRVFSESVDGARSLRLLCMQYVNGPTLQAVVRALATHDRATWCGRAILDAVAAADGRPELLDLAALRDRELLAACDFPEAVCWLGARVCEALAHAHGRGVFHRDVKPANILLNRYGRPFLADFNVSCDPHPLDPGERPNIGGTLGYMAPEHLDAFNPEGATPPHAVDARSDVYALGVVLFELLAGQSPFPALPPGSRLSDTLRALAAQRRSATPAPSRVVEVPRPLDAVVRRCLEPLPERRFQSAAALAEALDGCREQLHVARELPPAGPLTRLALRRPFLVALALLLLPHLLASVVNISYNALRIVERLTPEQQATFPWVVLVYNLAVYPACVVLAFVLIRPIFRGWRQHPDDEARLAWLRRRVLSLPAWAAWASVAGWLPGGWLFPFALHYAAPCCGSVFGHFVLSFTVAGLIALTYSVFGVQFVALRVLYPRFWGSGGMRVLARTELQGQGRWLATLQLLAGVIPLIGAVLMVAVGPEEFGAEGTGYAPFRLLVTGLIALGMAGFGAAMAVSDRLRQTLTALTGVGRSSSRPGGSGNGRRLSW